MLWQQISLPALESAVCISSVGREVWADAMKLLQLLLSTCHFFSHSMLISLKSLLEMIYDVIALVKSNLSYFWSLLLP